MKKIYLFLLATLLFLCGCQTKETAFLTINTVPSQASILLNGTNVGKSPVFVEIKTNEDGCFVTPTNIKALPTEPKNYSQEITFAAFTDEKSKQYTLVPEEIIFDLTKKPEQSPPTINY